MKLYLILIFICISGFADEAKDELKTDDQSVVDEVSVKDSATTQNNSVAALNTQMQTFMFKDLSIRTVVGYESNFEQDGTYSKASGATVEAFINYKLNDDYRTQLFISGEKNFTRGREEITRDSRLSLIGKNYKLYKEALTFTPSIIGVIPTSKTSRDRDRLNTAIELSGALNYTTNNYITLTYMPRFKKNFHELQTNREGTVLTDYSVLHFMFASFSITEKFSFNPGLIYVNAWNYNSTRVADSYLSILDVTYGLNASTALSLGVRTAGEVVDRQRGSDSNVEFIDSKNSIGYLNLSKSF